MVVAGATIALSMLRVINSMILTRLLVPAAFGLVGIIGSVFTVIAMLTDLGFQAYVVRHERGAEPDFLDAVWTIHASRGVVLTMISLALAYPFALAVDKPDILPLLLVASFTFCIDGTASLRLISAIREKQVVRLSAFDVGMSIIQVCAATILAAILRSAWALILAMLISSVARSSLSYILFATRRHRMRIDRALMRDMWGFSRLIMVSSAITLVLAQVDKLLLARMFSLADFGVYAIASGLAGAPVGIAFNYCSRVLYPHFAAGWRDERETMSRVFYANRGKLYPAYLFGCGGLIGGAPLLVHLLYDPRYLGAARYMAILAIASAMALPNRAMAEMFNAIGRTSGHLIMNVIRLSWLAVAGIGGFIELGPLGLVLALGLIELPPYLFALTALRRRHIASLRHEALSWLPALGGLGVGWSFAALVLHLFPNL